MSLRQRPQVTPRMIAANRVNARKSTGPRTAQGKARAALNGLKHGGYAVRLPERLVRAGDLGGAAQYYWFYFQIGGTFGLSDPKDQRQAQRFAARAWCLARRRDPLWSKAGIYLRMSGLSLPGASSIPIPTLLRIRIEDPWRRVGLVFWVQRPRYWTLERRAMMGREPLAPPRPAWRLEQRCRRLGFRTRKPGLWKLQKLEAAIRGGALRR